MADEIMNQAIVRYLDLHDERGRLMRMIQDYPELSEKELLKLLMEHSKEEGLGDVQALEMIRKVRDKQ